MYHKGANLIFETVILASWEEALRAPALRLMPAVVNSLQAARKVGVLGYVPAADLVICGYSPCNNWHHRVFPQGLLQGNAVTQLRARGPTEQQVAASSLQGVSQVLGVRHGWRTRHSAS